MGKDRDMKKSQKTQAGSVLEGETLFYGKPEEIEKRSFEILTAQMEQYSHPEWTPMELRIVQRVIHTTADFEYMQQLCFSKNAAEEMLRALKDGAGIVTDTQMARAGINKKQLKACGGEAYCFMSDPDVAAEAKRREETRAAVSVEKAARLPQDLIFAIGNAPTALLRLEDYIRRGRLKPRGIIGVPVGFVNVTEAKERIMQAGCPYIVARGRKGGSSVAAAICNALLYGLRDGEGERK